MNSISATAAGRFKIGDSIINRLGYGAMRITGRGIWGPPPDRRAALATLRRLPEIGVNFIDTADSYGPDVSEELIREALHPYHGLVIATKPSIADNPSALPPGRLRFRHKEPGIREAVGGVTGTKQHGRLGCLKADTRRRESKRRNARMNGTGRSGPRHGNCSIAPSPDRASRREGSDHDR
jgi:hypothetical protein